MTTAAAPSLHLAPEAATASGGNWFMRNIWNPVRSRVAAFARAVWNWGPTQWVRHAIGTSVSWMKRLIAKIGTVGTAAAAVTVATTHGGQKAVRFVGKAVNKTVRFLCNVVTVPFTWIPGPIGRAADRGRAWSAKTADATGRKVWESAVVRKVRGWLDPSTRPMRLIRDGAAATFVGAGALAIGGVAAVIGLIVATAYVAVRLANEFAPKKVDPLKPPPPDGAKVTVTKTVAVDPEGNLIEDAEIVEVQEPIEEPVPAMAMDHGSNGPDGDGGGGKRPPVVMTPEIVIHVEAATAEIARVALEHFTGESTRFKGPKSKTSKDTYVRQHTHQLMKQVTSLYEEILVQSAAKDAARNFLELQLRDYVDSSPTAETDEAGMQQLFAALRGAATRTYDGYALQGLSRTTFDPPPARPAKRAAAAKPAA